MACLAEFQTNCAGVLTAIGYQPGSPLAFLRATRQSMFNYKMRGAETCWFGLFQKVNENAGSAMQPFYLFKRFDLHRKVLRRGVDWRTLHENA